MARPKKNIDVEQVKRLAAIQCSYEEMAAVLDCDESTLTKRFSQVIQKGRSNGRMSLKRKQYTMAMGGNITMLIWLGKQYLGQRDKREEIINANITNLPADKAKALELEATKLVERVNAWKSSPTS